MSTDLLYFVFFLALLFRFRAASQSSSVRARERAERERILEMYAEFEAHVNGQVKQALRMIDKHSAAGTQGADSELSIITDDDLKKLEVASGKLLRRVGNVEEILSTLFEGKMLLFPSLRPIPMHFCIPKSQRCALLCNAGERVTGSFTITTQLFF